MNRHHIITILIASFAMLWTACDVKNNKVDPEMGFTKIYDTDSAEVNHFPIDIKQLADEGYLFLGYNLQGEARSIVVRTDKDGKLIWSKTFRQYLSPVSDLMKIGNDYYFVCAKDLTFEIALLKINDAIQNVEEVKTFDESTRPLAACALPDGGLLIQTYDYPNAQTVLMKLNATFALDNTFSQDGKQEFAISQLDLMDDRINNHLTFQGTRLPFFVSYIGESSTNSYIFNGVRDYDITLVSVNSTTGAEVGAVDGFRYKKCVSSFTYLGNNKAALSKFEDVNNFLIPSFSTLSLAAGPVNLSDLPSIQKSEITANSQIKSKLATIKGRKLVVYTTELKNNTVGLFAYDANTGGFAGARYFGNTYPYKIGNFVITSDGGMAVLCQTYTAGRFGRMCLFKLSKGQAEGFIN